MPLLKRLEVMSLINLIRNELYKIFHKKTIYIFLVIMFLYTILVNFVYYQEGKSHKVYGDNTFYDETYVGNEDGELKAQKKTTNDVNKFESQYDKDSWQRITIYENIDIANTLYQNYLTINRYEAKLGEDKKDYLEAKKEIAELQNKLDSGDWKYFIREEMAKRKEIIKENGSDADQEAMLEVLQMRLDYDIPYGNDYLNEYLNNYYYLLNDIKYYEGLDKLTASDERVLATDKAELEVEAYKIKNKINNSQLREIINDFYSIFSMAIIIVIIVVAGSILSEEFSKGTIKLLLVKPYRRWEILASKFITSIIIIFLAILAQFAFEMVIGGLYFGYSGLNIPEVVFDYSSNAIKMINIFGLFSLRTLAVLPQFILLATIAFALSVLFTNATASIAVTLVISFGSSVLNLLAQAIKVGFLKYFITLNWDFTCYLFGGKSPYDGISLPLSIGVSVTYFVILLLISFIVFQKKNIKNI